jgi:hypothetical protein
MCNVDFEHELGEAAGGVTIYASEKDLRKHRTCVNSTAEEDRFCYPTEVFTMSKDDYLKLLDMAAIDPATIYSSNIGDAIWTKEQGFVK